MIEVDPYPASVYLSAVDEESGSPIISGDGRFVVFESYARELVADDNGSFSNDVFVRERNP